MTTYAKVVTVKEAASTLAQQLPDDTTPDEYRYYADMLKFASQGYLMLLKRTDGTMFTLLTGYFPN